VVGPFFYTSYDFNFYGSIELLASSDVGHKGPLKIVL
jgi:hypothetical protein